MTLEISPLNSGAPMAPPAPPVPAPASAPTSAAVPASATAAEVASLLTMESMAASGSARAVLVVTAVEQEAEVRAALRRPAAGESDER